MSEIDVNQLLNQMRAMAGAAQGAERAPAAEEAGGPGFAALLKQSVDQVSDAQRTAGAMANAFAKGDPNVDLTEVMVALQKASVSFQAMTQVRNKLVEAYQQVMNMNL
ncbi:flagellar hook-basal body complex protein FliE [Thiohalobacter sp. IOR34]|uniref:flagellar hook-basal body complex protein FliE n=1 Tax=Thiohalobacter sp. IOR34 TaxID=3057176 RepID=UPI0025B167A3|nr:flagellar hook-basal body complex protein FliE [Thiohalobacter sp. IOR34]WJW74576.1 flagellar hook-basal body complex protein FliE [Thiohalobacter sp. IOR34]